MNDEILSIIGQVILFWVIAISFVFLTLSARSVWHKKTGTGFMYAAFAVVGFWFAAHGVVAYWQAL